MLAVLDANVLYDSQVRNLFLWCAVQDLFSPLWSEEIIDEVGRNIVRSGTMSQAQWGRLLKELSTHFADAWATPRPERLPGYRMIVPGRPAVIGDLNRPSALLRGLHRL